jgi:predicted DCC family thiol-disulfide oxidoreductase YuxK
MTIKPISSRSGVFEQKLARAWIAGWGPVCEKVHQDVTGWPDDDVILYDGVCVFCSRWAGFIARRDVAKRFRFTAIQSPYGTRLAQAFGIDAGDPDTNAVIRGGIAYFKSDGALTVLSGLPGWGWTCALFVVPRMLRNAVYNLVARNRYRLFGKLDACFVPDADMRARVLE